MIFLVFEPNKYGTVLILFHVILNVDASSGLQLKIKRKMRYVSLLWGRM